MPNETLSLSALGLMHYLTCNPDAPLSIQGLTAYRDVEGRTAITTALHELQAAGIITSTRERDTEGRWFTCRVFRVPENLISCVSEYQTPRPSEDQTFRPSGNPESQTLRRTDGLFSNNYIGTEVLPTVEVESKSSAEIQLTTSTTVGSGKSENLTVDVTVTEAKDGSTAPFPWVQRDRLRDWFGITVGESWQAAWASVTADEREGYDVEVHLSGYLLRCQTSGRTPDPGLWVKFVHEDRSGFFEREKRKAGREESDGAQLEIDRFRRLQAENHRMNAIERASREHD